MLQRVFTGYEKLFLPSLVEFLLADKDSLPETLVIVPTSQSGRTLRESLAERGKAILAPTVTTPGSLLTTDIESVAPRWMEKIAWIETLESFSSSDLRQFVGLFPIVSEETLSSPDWAVSMAADIVTLRTTLQNQLLNLSSAAKLLANTPEQPRWRDLAKIEWMMEKRLSEWGYTSRSQALRSHFELPLHFNRIILGGISEMPLCLEKALRETSTAVTAIVAAPESEASAFSDLGIPLDIWKERSLPQSAIASIHSEPTSQAEAALEIIARSKASSSDVALGSADDEVGSALTHVLTANGWTSFFPASKQAMSSVTRWLHAWKNWLTDANSRNLAALFTLPESAIFISGERAINSNLLNKTRDRHPVIDPISLAKILANREDQGAKDLHQSINALLSARTEFLSSPFPKAATSHLAKIESADEGSFEVISTIFDFLESASTIFSKVKRTHTFWLQLLLGELPAPPAHPPEDRVIDIQGWLELLYEPGEHLVICGMNDSFVPARSGGEPWLSETIRERLGLGTDSDRHARDAFLLHAMIRMRGKSGSAHLLCGQNGSGGDTHIPSRLLLKVEREELVSTVRNLFRDIEPPEGNLIWNRDWKWLAPAVTLPEHLSVTALKDYLSCPFRFYLKHLVRASQPEPDRREMNARDFGSITHEVLEIWGNDLEARSLKDASKLSAYFDAILDGLINRKFGASPPLAIRIQSRAIRQRLEWFAAEQAGIAADGWETLHIERKISIQAGEFNIRGTIDRVDRHADSGQLRVIDYKTGKVSNIENEHRLQISGRTRLPTHIPEDSAPFQDGTNSKGKAVRYLWKNLQLPLYALAESSDSNGQLPTPCYIHLGKTKENVKLTIWDQFSDEDLDAARSCMEWIVSQIGQRKFWPPAEKVDYDDFALLAQNEAIEMAFTEP